MYGRVAIAFLFALLLIACAGNLPQNSEHPLPHSLLKTGNWRMSMNLSKTELPFSFSLYSGETGLRAKINNASERLETLPFVFKDDSIFFRLPIFDSEFKGLVENAERFSGKWYNYHKGKNYCIPFLASYGTSSRFQDNGEKSECDLNGKWEVTFSPGSSDEYKAIALFNQNNELLTGTFLTETGDYRFLEGNVFGHKMMLSCFDGSHAFVFSAEEKEKTLSGRFYSGIHWEEPWVARRNDNFELTHPDSLTFLKPGYEKITFTFPDVEGKPYTFPNNEMNDKVVIIQIMGSWCPNCMDETLFLNEMYTAYHSRGLEILSLCFERSDDPAVVSGLIKNHVKHLNAQWKFLIAGVSSKSKAADALPMLNKIMSFPTTIYIDKSGNVRKIYTGFYGPGTGNYYLRFVEQTQSFIEKLLAE